MWHIVAVTLLLFSWSKRLHISVSYYPAYVKQMGVEFAPFSRGSFSWRNFPATVYCVALSAERACSSCQSRISFNFYLFINRAAMPTVDDWINNPLGIVDGLFGKT